MAGAGESQDRLPVYYHEKDKDVVTAADWVDRATAMQQSANWPPVKAVNECRLSLRGTAAEWYLSLELDQAQCYTDFGLFIQAFKQFTDIAQKPEDLIAQTSDLKQKPEEKVSVFYVRCRRVVMRHVQAASMEAIPANLSDQALEDFRPGIRDEIAQLQVRAFKGAFFHMLLTWFLAGLRPEIRGRLLDKRCLNHTDAYEEALSIEMALESQKGVINKPPAVFAVNANGSSQGEVDAVQQGGRGRGRGRGRGGRQQQSPAPGNNPDTNPQDDKRKKGPAPYKHGQRIATNVCAYCRKKGHWQKECHKRRREGGKLIKIFAVNESEDQFGDPPPMEDNSGKNDKPSDHMAANFVSYQPRGPPPGYPFPDPHLQAQQMLYPPAHTGAWSGNE